MKHKSRLFVFLALCSITFLAACNKFESTSDKTIDNFNGDIVLIGEEDNFVWEDNYISALSDKGKQQKSVVIPARCEGFSGVIFQNTLVENVMFESNNDIDLGLAFMGAETLKEVKLPEELTVIGSMSFEMCEKLKSITIPRTVTTIEDFAFSNCESLESIEFLGEELSIIDENCFEYCKNLKAVSLPDGIVSIEKKAFCECSALEHITFPESIKSISQMAFGNTAIKEIDIPKNVEFEYIDSSAFGMDVSKIIVFLEKDSWCDKNRDIWDIGFAEIKTK